MKYFQRIDEDCAIAAQLTPAQIQQLPHAGFHSVLNLRSAEESGVLGDEQQQIEALGLRYANVPMPLDRLNSTLAERVLATLQAITSVKFCIFHLMRRSIESLQIYKQRALVF